MEPERWQRIERLYHAALEVEESRRPAFLQNACGGDEALRREIEVIAVAGEAGGKIHGDARAGGGGEDTGTGPEPT